jgi:intracellular multiplication protein IcmG
MIDAKDTSTHDDEFHFDEFDHPENLSATEAGANANVNTGSRYGDSWADSIGQKNRRKLIIFAIFVVIILGFIIYHFAASWNNPFSDLNISKKAVRQPAVAHLQTATVTPSVPQPPASDEVITKVNTLDQTLNQQGQTITQLQDNMGSLQESINGLNTTVTNMSQKLASINDQLTKPKKAPKPVEAGPPPVTYIVKAMVPGRAWLQGSNGSMLSVTVGNEVPQHGTVTQIDLSNGQVLTSDGTAMTYDINGN